MYYMKLNDFIKKYTGVKCGNTDGNFGECVGLAMLWTENLGIGHTWGNAKDIYANAKTSDFLKIPNSPNAYPVAGDLMCWDKTMGGGFGHIAIVTESNADEDTFTVFEQNNPLGSPPKITKYTKWTNVIGWLRPKVLAEQTDDCEKKIKELEKELQKVTTEKDKYKQEARDSRDKIKELEKQLENAESLIQILKDVTSDLEQKLNDQKIENAHLSKELDDRRKELVECRKSGLRCQNELQKCKDGQGCTLQDFANYLVIKIKEIWDNVKTTKIK